MKTSNNLEFLQNINGCGYTTALSAALISEDPRNLAAVLEFPGVTNNVVDLGVFSTPRPIHYLVERLSDGNFKNMFECICQLVVLGADINIVDNTSTPPIMKLLNNHKLSKAHKRQVIEYLLGSSSVDLDLHYDGYARTKLGDQYPDMQLPKNGRQWDENNMFEVLTMRSPNLFCDIFADLKNNKSDNELHQIMADRLKDGRPVLYWAVFHGIIHAVEVLLEARAHVHCYPKTDENKTPLLIAVLEEPRTFEEDFYRCFELLLKEDDIDINQVDANNKTVFQHAVNHSYRRIIAMLLSRGAYVGEKDASKNLLIRYIDPLLLQAHLDSCITGNAASIKFDNTNFVPQKKRKLNDEIQPIEFLAKSDRHKHLLKHSVIASFLHLKWLRLVPVFYLNFGICLAFCMSMIPYIMIYYGQATSSALQYLLWACSLIGTFYVAIRESVQIAMSWSQYLRIFENYLEIGLFMLSLTVLIGPEFAENTQRVVGAITILLVMGEIFLLVGSMPYLSFNTHLVMLQTVGKTYLRVMLLFSILLGAFAMCFCMLFSPRNYGSDANNEEPTNGTGLPNEEEMGFNEFANPYISLVKTLFMFIGEFDASDIKFLSEICSYVIFALFACSAAVMLNLLNGLAVSDTQVLGYHFGYV